jgi:DNA polymerase I-like protein with 3'-5' exonuclease and polymerase domains
MESAHLRILAHLMQDPEYAKAVSSGDKKLGTDPHSLNMKALGDVCQSRDDAKTFIYTWMNGGGAAKAATIFRCSVPEARHALDMFTQRIPKLKHLLEVDNVRDAQRGYFQGIDGRFVVHDQTHKMLAGKLQNAEKIILIRAVSELFRKYPDEPILLLNLVHDEVQLEYCLDDEKAARELGAAMADEYRLAAEHYNLLCPFAGGVSVGKSWATAH